MKLRILLFALFALIATPSFAGNKTLAPTSLMKNSDGKYMLERVIEVGGVAKPELYKRVKAWVMANVKANDVATTFDETNFDAIAVTTTLSIPAKNNVYYINQTMNFKLLLQFKEGKVRILLNNFVFYAFINGYNSEIRGPFETVLVSSADIKDISAKIDEIIPAFVADIERAAQGKDASNW